MALKGEVVVALAFLCGTAHAAEPGFTAKIYEPESKKQKVLFTQKQEIEKSASGRTATSTLTDPSGAVAAVEKTEFVKAGDHERVGAYSLSQKQLGTESSVTVKDGKATLSFTKGGQTKTTEVPAGDDFIVGPYIPAYLRWHWPKVMKGDKIGASLAVVDRQETIKFEFKKVGEEDLGGQKAVVVRMRPSSFFIAALVNPLEFYFTPDGEKLLELRGRTAVKRKVDGSYKDLDAVVVYEYPSGGNSK